MITNLLDAELIKRVQAGDVAAFDLLVQKYQNRVVTLAGRYLNDQSECYDVSQETFIKAYLAIANFRKESQFYTWIYRITVNTAKSYIAQRSRKLVDCTVEANNTSYFENISKVNEYTNPESTFLAEEIKQTIFSAIQSLPDSLRSAITLREIDGLSYDEIAEVTGCPVGTVRSRIFRAREQVDKELKPLLK